MASTKPAWLKGFTIGESAVFLSGDAADIIGPIPGVQLPSIVSKLGDGTLTIANVTFPRRKVGKKALCGMVPVKMVFGKDEPAILVIWDPSNAEKTVEFNVEAAGSVSVVNRQVQLDSYGLSVQQVRDLPDGNYTAMCGELTAKFTVAQHMLAALTAEYIFRPLMRGKDTIVCTVRLLRNTHACKEGESVTVELMQGMNRKGSKELKVLAGGILDVEFNLPKGEETLTLNFIKGSKTASLPLRGAKESERKALVANGLGQVFEVSTLGPGNECRGLFANPGATNNEPFLVESIVGDKGKITLREAAEVVLLQIVNPETGEILHKRYKDLPAQQVLEFPIEDFCVVYLAAFVKGKPYEAATLFLAPCHLSIDAEVPDEVEPGCDAIVTLRTNSDDEVPVLLTVLDKRTVMPTTFDKEAAACMKSGAEALMKGISPGEPKSDFGDVIPPGGKDLSEYLELRLGGRPIGGSRRLGYLGESPLRYAGPSLSRSSFGEPLLMAMKGGLDLESKALIMLGAPDVASLDSLEAAGVYTASVEPDTSTAVQAKPREKFPEVVFCGIVYVRGSKEVVFTAPDAITDLTVCAQAISGLEVVVVEKKIPVTKALNAEMETPLFISESDEAAGRIHVGSKAGEFSIELTCDGVPVDVYSDGSRILNTVKATSADFTFPVDWTGIYELIVSDGANTDRSVRVVSEIGKMSYVARSLTFLSPGESIEADDDTLWIRPLPGLEEQIAVSVDVAASYDHLCCEQTACKIRAASLMWLGGDDDRKRKAESIILAGVAREKSMHLPGKGFKMYPNYGDISLHYSPLAARHLYLALKPLSGAKDMSRALIEACAEGLKMAEDVASAHGVSFAPKKLNSCMDAYLAYLAGHEGAVEYVLIQLKPEGDYLVCGGNGAVNQRAETAYAAAILFIDGKHLESAIRAANYVAAGMKDGTWYSTIDTAAGLAMLGALASCEVVVSGKSATNVEVNGISMSLTQALAFQGDIRQISLPDDSHGKGVLAVQVCKARERDLTQFNSNTPFSVSLQKDGKAVRDANPGDEIVLKLSLAKGYKPGDLAMVMLPPSLSFVFGGTQVKTLNLDFSGASELQVPIVVTCDQSCEQSFVACVTNMFEEERGGNPGPIKFAVTA